MNPSILMVEDDLNFGAVLKAYLELNDFTVTWVQEGRTVERVFSECDPNLCLLDVVLPYADGFTIAGNLRKINPRIPIIFITARTLKEDILHGYRSGADEYIVKPFDSDVLICKIRAVLSRSSGMGMPDDGDAVFRIGIYAFNYPLRVIRLEAQEHKLSPREAELLRLLCINMNKVLPRDATLKLIWGDDNYFTTRSMDVFITKLRKCFKEDPLVEIRNIHGSGFMLTVHTA